MNLRAAAQQALEALEMWGEGPFDSSTRKGAQTRTSVAINALRTAIEQAEKQEPVAWVCYGFGGEGKHSIDFYQAEIDEIPVGTLLYTTPPAAQRKPLTDEEVDRAIERHAGGHDPSDAEYRSMAKFARAIERAHGIGGEA